MMIYSDCETCLAHTCTTPIGMILYARVFSSARGTLLRRIKRRPRRKSTLAFSNDMEHLYRELQHCRNLRLDDSGETARMQFALKTINATPSLPSYFHKEVFVHTEHCYNEQVDKGDTAVSKQNAILAAKEAYKNAHIAGSELSLQEMHKNQQGSPPVFGCGVGVCATDVDPNNYAVAVLSSFLMRSYSITLKSGREGDHSDDSSIVAEWLIHALISNCSDLSDQRPWADPYKPSGGVTMASVSEEGTESQVDSIASREGIILYRPFDLPMSSSGDDSHITEQAVLFNPHPKEKHLPVPFFNSGVPWPSIVVPGSFNPFHIGHSLLVTATQRFLSDCGAPLADSKQKDRVIFELSATNVDKPPLGWDGLMQRVRQFAFRNERSRCVLHGSGLQRPETDDDTVWPVLVTAAPRFIEKARLLPNCYFVVGYDTAERLINPKYYDNSRDEMIGALIEMRRLGCRFIVAARAADASKELECFIEADGSVSVETSSSHKDCLTLADLANDIPPCARELFIELPISYYKLDLSSSALRKALKR
eukprot:gb/GECG01002607.1/.p1 GENE.gb/GECG01002607.1/~~gb/GECG01002607.1/.p1  ORF type:complete len:537 (+),score=49.80 gb/GECG01002607.1/:1-1611(+)